MLNSAVYSGIHLQIQNAVRVFLASVCSSCVIVPYVLKSMVFGVSPEMLSDSSFFLTNVHSGVLRAVHQSLQYIVHDEPSITFIYSFHWTCSCAIMVQWRWNRRTKQSFWGHWNLNETPTRDCTNSLEPLCSAKATVHKAILGDGICTVSGHASEKLVRGLSCHLFVGMVYPYIHV